MKIDKKLIKELKDYLDEFNLSEIEYQDGTKKIKVAKNISGLANISSHKPNIPPKKDEVGIKITSPIIGTAYLAPEPGAKPFVELGKKIKNGDPIMIVEAMKTMNHVPSTSDGVVKEICVDDGQPVEFGQTIIILE